jgi:hypothetical protein
MLQSQKFIEPTGKQVINGFHGWLAAQIFKNTAVHLQP